VNWEGHALPRSQENLEFRAKVSMVRNCLSEEVPDWGLSTGIKRKGEARLCSKKGENYKRRKKVERQRGEIGK